MAVPEWDASTPTNIIWDVDKTASELHGITLVTNPTPGITIKRVHAGLYDPTRTNFSPRLALAYRLRPDTSVHAGYAIFYDFNQNLFQQEDSIMGNWPFGNPFFTNAGYNLPTVSNPLPTNIFGVNVFPPVTFRSSPPLGGGFTAQPHQWITPYVQEWNVGVDHSFQNDWSLAVTYVGSKGTHLGTDTLVNVADSPGPGPIGPRIRLPNLLGPYYIDPHWFNSSYNAAEVKLEKRYSQGVTLLAAYTYGKSIDEGSVTTTYHLFQNPLDFKADRAASDYDLTHILALSTVYELPFGEGKRFANSLGWASRFLIGGWQISGILSLNNGFPFYIIVPFDNANIGGGLQRPTVTGPLVPSGFQQTPDHWFDTSNLTVIPYTFGNLGRNVLRQDGYKDFDLAAAKRFRISETKNLEFRAEAFNFFNHPNFAAPDGNFSSPTFGRVLGMNGSPRDIQFGLKLHF